MRSRSADPRSRLARFLMRIGVVLALVWLAQQVFDAPRRTRRVTSQPPSPDALRPEQAHERAAELGALDRPRRIDLATEFAPTVATSVEPLLHGSRYFPRMIEDFEAAEDHVHILIYGYKPGDIGQRIFEVLAAKVREGVSVRLEVDSIGSEINFGSQRLFAAFRDAGIETVANFGMPVDRLWPYRVGGHGGHREDLFHFDHRKFLVVDGRVGYVGGSGIEDHFNDERFYDVMCRLTGPVVAQLQLVFLASWSYHGGAFPAGPALDACFPADVLAVPDDAEMRVPATLLWNVPGAGHHPISDALEQALADAQERIEIVNPYISNREVLDLLYAAAERGVRVRIVVPGKPTPPFPAAVFRHHVGRLLEAGAEILLHPEMAHAKVATVDDQVFIGGCNLDDLSLFRNDELDVLLRGRPVVDLVDRDVFEELVAMSSPASPATRPAERLWNMTWDRLSRFL